MSLSISPCDEGGYLLESSLHLPRPVAEVFPFFADARNLQSLTPKTLQFEVLTPEPLVMQAGLRIDYRLKVHRVPLRWQSEITAWDPPHRFVDEQRRGPYRWWIHEHTFVEESAGCLVGDRVRYGVWGGRLVNALVVARDLRKIFAYRTAQLEARFG